VKQSPATTRCVVAATVAVLFGLPAAVRAADGATDSNSGGGATYYETTSTGGEISLDVASGAWVGRATRISGTSKELAGRSVEIERRASSRRAWEHVATVPVDSDGEFAARWTPESAGRQQLRAVSASAVSADASARTASAAESVTVYRRVTATWYGPGFYGHRTACGQRLTTETLGVAHKTLPCGSRVAIRFQGRSITVPVIDRGPYARGVSYDLTSATARRLGVTGTSQIGAAVLTR
jgi:rare lipoprotein A